jgi:hypothetical protein
MHRGNLSESLKWALIGGIAAMGIAGLNIAIGQSGAIPGRFEPNGWRYKATYDSKDWPQMKFELTVENTEASNRDLSTTLKLVRQEFKGNPGGRSFNPSDIESKDLESQPLKANLQPHTYRTFHIAFTARANEEAKLVAGFPRISYALMVEVNGRSMPIGSARPLAK